ncbi:MAG: CCA tRNA nucleotidyltransferase [Puniceicoccaceae bacterium]
MASLTEQFHPQHWSFLKNLANACHAKNGTAYLVGGCVRSGLLGETVNDFDLEVFGLPPDVLETVLESVARVKRVGKAFGIYKLEGWPIDVGLPRRERRSGIRHRDFSIDIIPDMSLEEAARRRDFRMNAIYYDIRKEKILDPLGGLLDLENRALRHCSPRFSEDPLRVLRGMQLAARIPATVAPDTLELCRQLTPESLSPERFFGEWEKLILYGRSPSNGLAFLKACDWTRFFPELHAMIGCEQDPQWHPEGDVWDHTLHCMDAFSKGRTGIRDDDLAVGLAVLCHDMGKPLTTERHESKIRSHGHESAGVKPARRFLEQLRVSGRLTEVILPLIKCHMRPGVLFEQKSSASAIRRLARDCGQLDLLLRVFQADSAGRPPLPDESGKAVQWLTNRARELEVSRSGPKPILKGTDLLQRGWQSGPKLGRFLNAAYEAQLDGSFTSREEALQWLDDQLDGKSSVKPTHCDDAVS